MAGAVPNPWDRKPRMSSVTTDRIPLLALIGLVEDNDELLIASHINRLKTLCRIWPLAIVQDLIAMDRVYDGGEAVAIAGER